MAVAEAAPRGGSVDELRRSTGCRFSATMRSSGSTSGATARGATATPHPGAASAPRCEHTSTRTSAICRWTRSPARSSGLGITVFDIGPTARAHAYSTLRTILNTAVLDDELLARNPAYIRGAGVSGHRKNLRPASLEKLAAMVEAMPEQRRLLLLLATWCALRSGELRSSRRSDI